MAERMGVRCRAMTFDEVREWLEKDGWTVEVISDVSLRSRFRGGARVFPMFIYREPLFISFAVIPFAKIPEDPYDADVLMRRLLKLNREINMAKFSIDEDGDVVLSVEYRIENLDPSEVRDAVDVLAFYAEKFHAEVEDLAEGS
jgi:hypothetical protein